MKYSEDILKAHEAWKKAEDAIPEHEYDKGYKSRTAKARKLWREFSSKCEKEGLKPVSVANSFLPKTVRV